MNELDIFLPSNALTAHEIPLHEKIKLAWLLKYRNPNTFDGHRRALDQWFAWCAGYGLDPMVAKRHHIQLWSRLLEVGGNQPATVHGKLAALAGFYRYATIEEIIERDPMLHVDRPKVIRESRTNGVNRHELNACLEIARVESPRSHALICLLGLNGFRISEVLGIDITDLSTIGPYPVVKIHRKGGKTETQPLGYRAHAAVTALVDGRTNGPLFVTANGERLLRQAAGRIVKRIARKASIDKRVSPHSFRHGFVTIARNAGVPTRDIMSATGHADERMITFYDREKHNIARSAVHGVEAYVAGAS